ncbi:MAG: hypothetical protein HOV79_31450 [Hamadaea sp.]|nr:hypothetical protein [Hamadaea sp.]
MHIRYTNDGVTFHDAAAPGWTSNGSDGCGSFSEKQATGPANNIGTTEVIDWGFVQDWFFPKDNDYLYKVTPYIVRNC